MAGRWRYIFRDASSKGIIATDGTPPFNQEIRSLGPSFSNVSTRDRVSTPYTPGSQVGGYLLHERLGGGSFSEVWRAQAPDGGTVALKVLTGRHSDTDAARLRAEISSLAAATAGKSQHVVRVLDGDIDGSPYIVTDYVESTDLAREIERRGRLIIPDVLRIALDVLEALTTLERAGIVHRDVKPANVLVDREGVVRLAGFGVAQVLGFDALTAIRRLPMTMAYAAPEVWAGEADARSDLYALGAMLYHCLTGAPPFTGSYAAVYRQHLSAEPFLDALPAETPTALRALIAGCLEKNAFDRPVNAAAARLLVEAAERGLAAAVLEASAQAEAVEPQDESDAFDASDVEALSPPSLSAVHLIEQPIFAPAALPQVNDRRVTGGPSRRGRVRLLALASALMLAILSAGAGFALFGGNGPDETLARGPIVRVAVETANAVPTPTPVRVEATPAPAEATYTVVTGDSLWAIAERHRPPAEELSAYVSRLAALNGIAAGAQIDVGQLLRLPGVTGSN